MVTFLSFDRRIAVFSSTLLRKINSTIVSSKYLTHWSIFNEGTSPERIFMWISVLIKFTR
jgi:hypothetical protein